MTMTLQEKLEHCLKVLAGNGMFMRLDHRSIRIAMALAFLTNPVVYQHVDNMMKTPMSEEQRTSWKLEIRAQLASLAEDALLSNGGKPDPHTFRVRPGIWAQHLIIRCSPCA